MGHISVSESNKKKKLVLDLWCSHFIDVTSSYIQSSMDTFVCYKQTIQAQEDRHTQTTWTCSCKDPTKIDIDPHHTHMLLNKKISPTFTKEEKSASNCASLLLLALEQARAATKACISIKHLFTSMQTDKVCLLSGKFSFS